MNTKEESGDKSTSIIDELSRCVREGSPFIVTADNEFIQMKGSGDFKCVEDKERQEEQTAGKGLNIRENK